MENRSQYDDLLTKYLLNELSSSDEENVSKWINSDAENTAYFEQFRAIWNLSAAGHSIDTIDVDQEWNYHRRVVGGGELIMRPQENYQDIPGMEMRGKGRIHRFLAAAAIAASLLLVAGLWAHFFDRHEAGIAKKIPAEQKTDEGRLAVLPVIQTEINSSEAPRQLTLDDGSRVVLYANSEVSYEKVFIGNTRDIQLKGKADFKVFKDRARPFIVHSGAISTTALGTEFTVTAFENAASKSIKLYEGRVVIRSADSAARKLKKDFYLLPGQELIYNNKNATAVVRAFNIPGRVGKNNKNRSSENLSLPDNYKGSWYMFNNQSLPEVFNQLEGMFNVDIEYTESDLDKMYFIGKFDKTDSLQDILNRMAILYHLKLTRQNNKYLISK